MMDVKVYIWNVDANDKTSPLEMPIASWDVPIIPGVGDILLVDGLQMKIVKWRRDFEVKTIKKPGVIDTGPTLIINVNVYLVPAKEEA